MPSLNVLRYGIKCGQVEIETGITSWVNFSFENDVDKRWFEQAISRGLIYWVDVTDAPTELVPEPVPIFEAHAKYDDTPMGDVLTVADQLLVTVSIYDNNFSIEWLKQSLWEGWATIP